MKIRSLLPLTTALLLALACAAPAHAGEREGKGGGARKGRHAPGHLFAKFDKDGSGSLTSDEVPEKLWARLSKADADGDGAVTKAEAKAAHKKHCGKKRGGKRGGKERADD